MITELQIIDYIISTNIFRPSKELVDFIDEDGNVVKRPCSFYYKPPKTKTKILIRVSNHGTSFSTWVGRNKPDPRLSDQNLSVVFSNNGVATSNLKSSLFFVVEQFVYNNKQLTTKDLEKIINKIITLKDGELFSDPIKKARKRPIKQLLIPTDYNDNELPIPSQGVNQRQIDLAKIKREKGETDESYSHRLIHEYITHYFPLIESKQHNIQLSKTELQEMIGIITKQILTQ